MKGIRIFSVLAGLFYPLLFLHAHDEQMVLQEKTPTQEQVKETMTKAVNYLLGKQERSGAWPGDHGSMPMNLWEPKLAHTVIVAKALLSSREIDPKRIDEALTKVLGWLEKYQSPGRQSGMQLQDSGYGHIFTIDLMLDLLGCEQTLITKENIQKILSERLKSLGTSMVKAPEGYDGWGYPKAPTTFLTSSALLTLSLAKAYKIKVDNKLVESSVKMLKDMEIHPFYYLYEVMHLKGDKFAKIRQPEYVEGGIARVCSITLGLYLNGEKKKEDVAKAVEIFFKYYDSLEKARKKGGNTKIKHINELHGVAPYFYLYGSYYAAVALRYVPEEIRKKYIPLMQEELCKIQSKEGTWIDFHYIGRVYGTGMGLLALSELEKSPIEQKGSEK